LDISSLVTAVVINSIINLSYHIAAVPPILA